MSTTYLYKVISPLIMLLFSSWLCAPCIGQAVQRTQPPVGVDMSPALSKLHVGDVAPLFKLPTLENTSNLWDAHKELGQRAMLVFLIGPEFTSGMAMPPIEAWIGVLQAADTVAREMNRNEAEVVVIFPRADVARTAARIDSKFGGPLRLITLVDTAGEMRRKVDVPAGSLVLAAIDRSGFIRRIERLSSLPDDATLRACSQVFNVPTSLQVGESAPDFMLHDMNGQQRRLSDLKNKKHLLLTFFPKCFTGNCTQQVVSLQKALPELGANDVEVWGVSVDPAEGPNGQRAFAAKHGLQFPLIPDTGRNLSILYGAAQSSNQLASRMSMLIDKEGVVRWIDKQMNVKTHGVDVLSKLQELDLSNKAQMP